MEFPPGWTTLYDRPLTHNGYVITFAGPWYAKVRTDDGQEHAVTDWDCAACDYQREEGDDFCQHQEAMFAVLVEADDQAAPDVDGRREAYYEAGRYPPFPVYY